MPHSASDASEGMKEMKGSMKRLSERATAVVAAAALVASLAMSATPALGLNADGLTDDGNASITVHKYKSQSASNVPGTGSDGQSVAIGAEPLENVSFTLSRLDTAKVEGAVANVPAVKSAPSTSTVGSFLSTYGDPSFTPVGKTTGTDGTASWTGLKFGYYLLVETDAGGANVDMAVPSIITLPYAQQAVGGTTSYTANVHVYPKNVSREEVEKTVLDVPDSAAPGDNLHYQIAFKVPAAGKVYVSDTSCMKGTVVDAVPSNVSGQFELGMTTQQQYTAVALTYGGVEKPLTITDFGYSDTSATDGKVTWTITPAIAKAVEEINTAAAGTHDNQVSKIIIRMFMTVKPQAYNARIDASGQPSMANTAYVTVRDADGNTTIDNKPSTADSINISGFKFVKVDASNHPITSDTAVFKLAPTYEDAVAGRFVKDGITSGDLTATTSTVDGSAVFSGLSGTRLQVGNSNFTAVAQAVQNARSNLGVPQTIELWLVETKAPNGYRILQAPQKVTLQIVKANADAKITTTVVGDSISIVNTMNGQEGGGNFALPNTGGIGAIVFLVAGAAIAAFGVATFARSRKRDKDDASKQ